MLKAMLILNNTPMNRNLVDAVDWESNGFKLVDIVHRSTRVINQYLTYKPDVIFIEYMMPVIDGIELSHRIHQLNPSVKIVMINSNNDYFVAKEAINNGVNGLIDTSELNQATITQYLCKYKDELIRNQEEQSIIKQYGLRSLIRKRTLNKLYTKDAINVTQLVSKVAIMVIKQDYPYTFWYNNTKGIDMPSLDRVPFEAINIVDGISLLSKIDFDDNMWTLVIEIKDKMNRYQIEKAMHQLVTQFQEWFRFNTGRTVSIAYLTSFDGLNDLPSLHNSAKELLKYTIFMDKEAVMNDTEILNDVESSPIRIREYVSYIYDAVRDEDRSKIINNINVLFDKATYPHWNLTVLRKVCVRLVHVIDFFRVDFEVRTLDESLYEDHRIFDELYTIKSIKMFFVHEYDKLLAIIKERKNVIYSLKVEQCIHYLHKYYNTNIGVKDAGKYLGVNEVYLGQLFKREVGMSLLEYLTKHRIEKAKVILKNDKCKVYEVANMVGYNSSQYFDKVFHKITGQSPSEYRMKVICYSRRKENNN